jgi:hypothetical protein
MTYQFDPTQGLIVVPVRLYSEIFLESVIPECFYRESRRDRNGPPIKTFGGDAFKLNPYRYILMACQFVAG